MASITSTSGLICAQRRSGCQPGSDWLLTDDPTLGRWLSTDPVPGGKPAGSGQFHSPYVYAGNNPLVMVDPDGEFSLFALAYYAWQGYNYLSYASMAYQIVSATAQGGFDGFVDATTQIGFSMGIGGFVGGIANFGSTLGARITSGVVSGSIAGGATSSMFGGSFGTGALHGGVSGGIGAGINWLGNHASLNIQADDLGLTGQSAGPATDDNLQTRAKNWHNREEGKEGLRTLEVARKGNLGEGYYIDRDGDLANFIENTKANGVTYGPADMVGWSDVRISQKAFSNDKRLFLVLGHEFVHVDQFYEGRYKLWRNMYDKTKADAIAELDAYGWMTRYAGYIGWINYRDWAWEQNKKYYRIYKR